MTRAKLRSHKFKTFAAIAAGLVSAGLVGCGGGSGGGPINLAATPATPAAVPATPATVAANLKCDESMKTAFTPDALTRVLLVRAFKPGDQLLLSGAATATTPVAANEICLVKLIVGPGNPGPANAPSTTAGIGIEVWLPSPARWIGRMHLLGGAGMAGGPQTSLTAFATAPTAAPWTVAGIEGAVAATTDTGHVSGGGEVLMNPDGTVNALGWSQFSAIGIHEMTLKAKALATAYYGAAPKYTYWHGGSTGGRQGLKQAQDFPEDFDGIIATSPAINWSRFTTAEVYPQLVIQRDLAGVGLTAGQMSAVSNAAISACDLVGGQHLGFILDPSTCSYDPTTDPSVLCAANGGTNTTANCVMPAQAAVFNKIWYGQTSDGSVPSPSVDNGYAMSPTGNQRWYGLPRGADLGFLVGPSPFSIATDTLALELQDPTLAGPTFVNATGDGASRWKSLSYGELSNAFDRGVALQGTFANINTDNPDLSKFRARGGKMITVYGLSDNLIFHQGFLNYYSRVASQLGGIAAVQNFYKVYLVPGFGHFPGNGTANPNANPPLPSEDQNYANLTSWVEKGIAPDRIDISSPVTAANPIARSLPLCVYPKKATYVGGDINQAVSYSCS